MPDTYSTVLNSEGDTTVFAVGNPPIATPNQYYPPSDMETMFGPVLLPKIYAKGLSALEIASSGSIVLSVNDFETLHIENDEDTRETKFQSQSNYWLSLQPQDVYRTVAVGDHTWSSEDDYQVMRTTNPEGYKMEADLRIEGAVSFSNDLTMDSDMNLLGSAFIKGILSVNSNVFVESKVELGDTLSVEQEAIFADTLSVAETVYLSSNLSVEGHAWIEGGVSIGSNLSVEKEVIFSDTLSVSKEVYLSSDLSVEGRGWVEGAVELGDTLSVKDIVYLSSNLSVHDEVFLNSNLSVQGNLTVLDWVELDSTLSVLDAVTFSDTLSVGKEVYLSSNLSVADTVYLASNLEVVGDIRVDDEAFFNGTVLKVPVGTTEVRPEPVNRYTGSIFYNEENKRFEGLHDLGDNVEPQWMPLGSTADIDGDTYIKAEENPGTDDDHLQFFAANATTPRMIMNSNLLSVNLELVVASNLSVGLDVVFADILSVGDAVTFADTLSVGELVYLSSHLSVEGGIDVMSNVFLDSALSVKGETDIVDRVQMGDTLSVFKEAYLHSNLSVGGEVDVIGASRLKDTLSVLETVYLNSNLSVGENLFVDLDLSIGNDLTVDNDTLIKRALYVESNVFMREQLSVLGKVELANDLSVQGNTEMGGKLSVKSDVFIHHDSTLYTNKIMHGFDRNGGGELIIDVESLHVKGNLEIEGTTNTTNTYTTDMFVEDRAIVLATSSNFTSSDNMNDPDYEELIKDGLLTNDKSGIRVAGVPDNEAMPNSETTEHWKTYGSNVMWEKSFLWNFNEGMPQLGYIEDILNPSTDSSKRDRESFWELRGGAFHLSALRFDSSEDVNNLVTVKYGFRINAGNELEIIQKLGEKPSKRVAKFGIGSAF